MNLLHDWNAVRGSLKDKNVFLFLDYDGTLAPIALTPDEAVLPSEMKKALLELTRYPGCKIAIVSGRALDDVERLVGLEKVFYVGDHGFRIRGPEVDFKRDVSEKTQEAIRHLADSLRERLAGFSGIYLQPKDLTLSCHYRQARRQDLEKIRSIFDEVVRPFVAAGSIRIFEGKEVFEVRPTLDWDKGKAVSWLLENAVFESARPVIPIYVGDDTTDVDAFRVLSGRGLSIWVGEGQKYQTDYHLNDPIEVLEFVNKIKALFAEAG